MNKSLFFVFCFIVGFSTYGQQGDDIFKKVFKTSSERWVPVNVVLDNSEIGEISVKFVSNKAVAVINAKTFFADYVSNDSKLSDMEMSLEDLKELGVELVLNKEKFYLLVKIDLKVRQESVTDFTSNYKPQWVKNESRASDFSFFSNFVYYMPYAHQKEQVNPSELDMLPNVKLYNIAGESSHTYKDDFVARKFSRITYDHLGTSSRVVLGDNAGPSTEYISPIEFLGSSFGTDFSLKPYDVTVPRGNAEFDLKEPSTVKVYVNGSLLQILRLQPGKHNLEELPLIQGLNEVKLVIESDLGRIDEIIIPASFSQDLLKEGLADFYYGFGKKSEVLERDVSYLDDQFIFTSFHRYGFTKNFTLGGYFQADEDGQLFGSDQVYSTNFGQFKTQFFGSNESSNQGGSIKGEYYYLDRSVKGESATGHLLGLEWQTPDFKLIGEDTALNYHVSTLSYSFNSTYKMLNYRFGAEYEWNEDHADSWNSNLGLGRTFFRKLNINFNSNYKQDISGSSEFDFSVYFNWYLSEIGHNLYGNYNSTGNNSQLTWQKLQNSASDEFAYQVTARNDDAGSSMEVDANYNHQRIETGIRHTQTKTNGDNWNHFNGRLKLASAIGFAGGKFSIGRPVTDGFAIIHRDDLTENQDIKINKAVDDYAFESDFFNTMMISKLQAYRYFHLRIDPSLLDDGLSLEKEEFSLFPTYRGGILISLKATGSISAYGKLLMPDGKSVKLQTFDIVDEASNLIQRSFSNRKGRILAEGLNPGVYEVIVELDKEKYKAKIDLSNEDFGLVDLKTIKLVKVK
jgi:outer membrane usher protein FimD/PapC